MKYCLIKNKLDNQLLVSYYLQNNCQLLWGTNILWTFSSANLMKQNLASIKKPICVYCKACKVLEFRVYYI
jgi:hypothetical protein